MYSLLSIFGARLSHLVPKKGRDPCRSISMENLRKGWVELRVSGNWPAVILSGVTVRVCHRRTFCNTVEVDRVVRGFPQSST